MKLRLFSTSSWLLPLISALITLLIYLPGLNGDFEFDDGPNILDNAAIKIETMSFDSILAAALSGKSGPFGRSISMLSFAGNYYFTQLEPFFFVFRFFFDRDTRDASLTLPLAGRVTSGTTHVWNCANSQNPRYIRLHFIAWGVLTIVKNAMDMDHAHVDAKCIVKWGKH